MRVPHSPHNLRRVMPVSSVKSSMDDGDTSSECSSDANETKHILNGTIQDLHNNRLNSSTSPTSRPPRPTYTSKCKGGKYTVGVEAGKTEKTTEEEKYQDMQSSDVSNLPNNLKDGSTTMSDCYTKEHLGKDYDANMIAETMSNNGVFHRSRDRTRVSAVQRLVERKLAQKEKEKLRQRAHDEKTRCRSAGNDLLSSYRRSASTNGYISTGVARHRSRDRSSTRADSHVLCAHDISNLSPNLQHIQNERHNEDKKHRTNKENQYFANLLQRTSRSCDRLGGRNGDVNDATKTFITISAGKPTRIREQSPCKRDNLKGQDWKGRYNNRKYSTNSSASISSSSDEEISSPPIKVCKSQISDFATKPEQPNKRDAVLGNTSPLKSTGLLLREFSFIKEDPPKASNEFKARKTSYTTEKTIEVNNESRNRKLSIDISLLSKSTSNSPESKFCFNHKRCNNSPTSDLPSTPSDFSTNSPVFQSSSSSLSGSGANSSSDSSTDVSSKESSSSASASSSPVVTESSSAKDNHLSKRRISLEQRIKARSVQPTTFPSSSSKSNTKDTDDHDHPMPQPRLRERRSKLSAASLKTAQVGVNRSTSNQSLDSDISICSVDSLQDNEESEAYSYDVKNIISSEGNRYQRVSVTTQHDALKPTGVNVIGGTTRAMPRRRSSQGNLTAKLQQSRLPKNPSPRRRKISLPAQSKKRYCDNFKEEADEEIYNHQQTFRFSSGLGVTPENPIINSQADQKKEEGNQLYKTKNYRDALQRYSEAINLCPDCPAFYGNRSACHMMLSQFSQALEDAKCSVQKDQKFVKGYVRVAKCCVALGDTASAQQAIDKALELEPNNIAILQEKSSIQQLATYQNDFNQAYAAKDFRKALFCLDRALSISSASKQLKISRAECLAFLGRYSEAQEVANDLLRLDNINAEAIYVRGLCLYYEDNVDKAFTHFQQVLRLAPDHTKAKEIYKKAKQLKQKKEEGNGAFKSGKLEDAYKLYSEALQIDPFNKYTNAKLFFNRATVAAKLKKLKESIQDCTSALELDEKYFKAVLRRAKSYMDLEMYEEAVRDYELANKMERGNHEVRQLLQQAKLELKKSKRKDYYKILGVAKDANDDEIKKAYRKRALIHHPDRHSSASEDERKEHEKKFKEVGEAYGVLSDTKKRARYDQGHDIDDLEGHGHGGFGGDIDPNQIFQAFFSQGGGQQQHFSFGGQGGMPGGFSFQFG